jgi:protein-tyrosine phosphatase
MIDLHSHILPGLDDGSPSVDAALEMARSAIEDGIVTLAATPHVRDDYPTSPIEMEERLYSLRERLAEASIPLELLPGGEIALDMLPELDDRDLRRFGLGGNPAFLLLETPDFGWPLGLEQTLFQLRLRGFSAVLAHPERNAEVQEDPGCLVRLVETGTLVQLTAASVDGRLGPHARRCALRLIELGLAHMLAGDAHAPSVREIGLRAAARQLGDPGLAHWMTVEVPRAVVAGEAAPERPPSARGPGLRRRLGRRRGMSGPPAP